MSTPIDKSGQDPLCTQGLLHATYPSLTVKEMEPFEPVWENLQLDTNTCVWYHNLTCQLVCMISQ